jgi:transcriptional regulator with AAA-type ATPase domain
MGMQKKKFLRCRYLLQEYDWTGNIRELRNVVERLIILGGTEFPKMM